MKKHIKLSLGCGNKFFSAKDGWVNVDFDTPSNPVEGLVSLGELSLEKLEEYKDIAGIFFIEDDITTLKKIPDDSIQEILCIHAFEHIYLHQLETLFTNWKRVLKKGGTITIESPDIIKCCINTLNLLSIEDPNVYLHAGLRAIYGGTEGMDEAKLHKWGWCFKTLRPVVEGYGFTNITESPALTHYKEQRDFRLTAAKG